ncbi:DUF6645 domain-containing protein [Escherichia coli]|uniref:Conserved hypothetical YjhS family protein encoded by n=1 Tax=Escherichia coli TA447 TaxID=656447 RepID=A0A1X3J4Y7_ECOLX|nr:DUF6645 domain-containing protein [Escherichia coli]OSK97110.1 conserved hypothetical YjhS family protein encoded by [Escherichia coli TA447]
MTFKHYDVVRAASPADLAERMTQKLKEGWQPLGAPVVITPYTLMQAIGAEGDVVVSNVAEPDWYYVVVLAGQSNAMSYGEGLPLPDSFDRPEPRIKQLARRSTVTPGGAACKYNDIIPADHCLHDVQDMSGFSHPRANLSKGQYGCVGQGLHIAKRLLPYIPADAGILLVPCCRGGAGFTVGNNGSFSEQSGATENSTKWGSGTALYQDLISRTKAALAKDPKNVLLAVCWMQGESDMKTTQNAGQHKAMFTEMVKKFRADLTDVASQCNQGDPESVPWICGDTTYYWKKTYAAQYETVYGGYKQSSEQNVFFVPFMTDGTGANVPTNDPAEDPDIAAAGYYGAASRTQANWTSSTRNSHFSSWARRGIIADRLATALLERAGRSLPFISGVMPETTAPPPSGGDSSGTGGADTGNPGQTGDAGTPPAQESVTETVLSYRAVDGWPADLGWTRKNGKAEVTDDATAESGKALRMSKAAGAGNSWSLKKAMTSPVDLLTRGGVVSCRFKLEGALVANRYAFGLYLRIPAASVPGGVTLAESGANGSNACLLAFFIQTDATNISLMFHQKGGVSVGTYGAFDNDWHTLELRFAGNNDINVIPVLDGTAGTPFTLKKTAATAEDNVFTVTDISSAATHTTLIEYVTVEVNAATA